jgi:hypothetical protein
MKHATETELVMAEKDDRNQPDTGPEREEVRGVADEGDDFEEDDDDEDLEEDEDEGTL